MGRIGSRGFIERFPHIYYRESDSGAFLDAQGLIEAIQAQLRTIMAAIPNRALSQQVADHDRVGMALANRKFVDTNNLWLWITCSAELFSYVVLFQGLNGLPVKV